MITTIPLAVSVTLLGLAGCRAPTPTLTPLGGNVLILLTDDIGIDKTSAYGEHPNPVPTPTIDALAAEGILFRNAYATPSCSPSRASLLTGRHPSRHGIGRWIYPDTTRYSLPADELTIPQMLAHSPLHWSSAAVGKWHMVGFEHENPSMHPLDAGFPFYAGSLGNPLSATQDGNTPRSYENWEKDQNGVTTWTTHYMTVDTIDDAILLVETLPEPWLLYVATNGAHAPLHNPPDELLAEPLAENATELEQYTAMVQVVDAQLGRLLDAIPADVRGRTTIIYTSDNGTANEVDIIEDPWDPARAKGTVYEGGVNVPFIVSGPLVGAPGQESDALVSFVDVLPTIAEIAGVALDTLTVETGDHAGQPITFDGHSLIPYLQDPSAPSQPYVFTEQFYPNGDTSSLNYRDRMVRNADWKLVRHETWEDGALTTTHEFYHFEPGAWDEGADLLEGTLDADAQAAYVELMTAMNHYALGLVYGHP